MSNDRLKFRSWLEVPIDTSKGTTVCGFYVYDVVVLPERNYIFPKGGYVRFPLETLQESLGRYRELENEIVEKLDINGNCEISEYLYAEPISIEQCTGLRDKNGRLIYEGDVIELTRARRYLSRGDKLLVKYDTDRYCGFGFNGGYALTKKCAENCIVIGNIHENPGLLEGK